MTALGHTKEGKGERKISYCFSKKGMEKFF